MKYSIIDIGGNTIRLNVYQITEDGCKKLFSKKNVAGLSSYVENNELNKRGKKKLVKVLSSLKRIHYLLGCDKLEVFATASLRNINNAEDVCQHVSRETGIEINILSANEEAKLGYLGSQLDYEFYAGVSLDIGGGSTELLAFHNDEICDILTLSQGSLSCYSRFVPHVLPEAEHFQAIDKFIKDLLPDKNFVAQRIIGIGGTIRAIGNIIQEWKNTKSNTIYKLQEILTLRQAIAEKNSDLIKIMLQVSPQRIHTIGPGLQILLTIMQKYDLEKVFVSDFGVREGYALQQVQQRANR